ncbi:putative leucine-rich repeat-containing protein DDB_G0290503 [Penaeus vannamei]|uniref:putative leucine-rich repeat-containing protein DDB_G0290503 n=1 Tax=Penaeus vannamei TaxID=6689 RepID=UPI00387F3F8E
MARFLWPVLVVLLILAVAGPCLTFYLLIKDYWAEVSSLRRDLLFCQLGSTDLPPLKFDLGLEHFPTPPPDAQDEAFPLPPAPLPLVATASPTPSDPSSTPPTTESPFSSITDPSSTTTEPSSGTPTSRRPFSLGSLTAPPRRTTSSSTTTSQRPATFRRTSLPPQRPPPHTSSPRTTTNSPRTTPHHPSSARPSPHDASSSRPQPLHTTSPRTSPTSITTPRASFPNSKGTPGSRRGRSRAGGFFGGAWAPERPFRSLDTVMVADESTDNEGVDTTRADMEYVALLERQLRDLRARVNACRLCLAPPQRNLPTCGGGPAWREHRRRNRIIRRKQRAQRKERRKQKKMRNETTTELPTTTTSTTTTTATTTTSTPRTETYLSDVGRSASDIKKDNARARENHRMSTDFRRGFNQKISRMDEALMQFTETQAAFCKELRDNLGGRLKKRGLELEALSDQIAALVRSSTTQISALEKIASDQLYAGQTSIEKRLALTQALRDSQLRAIRNYHKQTFLPAAAAIATVLSEQASVATGMGVELITKVEMLQDVYLTYATQQADTLQKLEQEVDMFASKHNNMVMRSRDHANHLHINTESFIRELQTRMNNVVKELVLIRLQSQNFVSVNNDTYNNISGSLNKTKQAVDDLSQGLRHRILNAKEREQDFRKIFKMETNQISDTVENGVSKALMFNHAVMNQIEDTELDTRVFVGSASAAWNELYLNEESELRKDADELNNNLHSHAHHTQNILSGLRSAAETHELVLEEQRMDFQKFIRKRQDALDTQCSAITDWAMLMSSELRRRDQDLHRFLSEDLQYTTVTVHEDADGYLVSRLPDGSLMYQSSPAHANAAHQPPNVTYQLDETVYSSSSASSASHSSRIKPQLEKTVVTSVNNSSKTFSESSKISTSSSISTSNSSNNVSVQNNTEHGSAGKKDSKMYQSNLETEKVDLNFSHHSNLTYSEGSYAFNTENSTNAMQNNGTELINSEESEQTSGMRKLDSNVKESDVTVKNENEDSQYQVDSVTDEATLELVLQKKKGDMSENDNRQNDGTYRPSCLHERRFREGIVNGNTQVVAISDDESYDNFSDEEDEGIKNLRKILKDAQLTIQKFQKDFKVDDDYMRNALKQLKLGNGTIADENVTLNSSSVEAEHATPHHRIRHQHNKNGKRKNDTSVKEELQATGIHQQASASTKPFSTLISFSSDNLQQVELDERLEGNALGESQSLSDTEESTEDPHTPKDIENIDGNYISEIIKKVFSEESLSGNYTKKMGISDEGTVTEKQKDAQETTEIPTTNSINGTGELGTELGLE